MLYPNDGEQGRLLFLITPNPLARRKVNSVTDAGWECYARHPNHYVRRMLASQSNCPWRILGLLVSDEVPAVRAAVVANPESHVWDAEDALEVELASSKPNPVILQALAWRKGLLPSKYRKLYRTGRWSVLIGLAYNTSCPKDILLAIAHLPVEKAPGLQDKNMEVRAIARRRLKLSEFTYLQQKE